MSAVKVWRYTVIVSQSEAQMIEGPVEWKPPALGLQALQHWL